MCGAIKKESETVGQGELAVTNPAATASISVFVARRLTEYW